MSTLFLDNFNYQTRLPQLTNGTAGHQNPIMITLPIPPSTNNLFFNLPRGGRAISKPYAAWKAEAQVVLMRQRPGRIMGEVEILIECRRKRCNSDISNRIKAVEDLLVSQQVIEDDIRVQVITAKWSTEIEECRVTITPVRKP